MQHVLASFLVRPLGNIIGLFRSNTGPYDPSLTSALLAQAFKLGTVKMGAYDPCRLVAKCSVQEEASCSSQKIHQADIDTFILETGEEIPKGMTLRNLVL